MHTFQGWIDGQSHHVTPASVAHAARNVPTRIGRRVPRIDIATYFAHGQHRMAAMSKEYFDEVGAIFSEQVDALGWLASVGMINLTWMNTNEVDHDKFFAIVGCQ